MYVVDSSARKATITLTGEEVAVKFPCTYSVFGIKGDSKLLYPKSGMAQGDDGVYDTAEGDGSVVMAMHYQTDTVYIKGTGDCVIWAGNSVLDCPFPKSGEGGGGSSGGCNYKGTTTTAIENGSTTNPITIDGEEYTAVFGDIVVYGYTEFVFDGTTWSEFGRPFDTTPTSGSANAVTSDGVYQRTPLARGAGNNSTVGGSGCTASASNTLAVGNYVSASKTNLAAFGQCNKPTGSDIFEIGNGTSNANRSNIVEVDYTHMNVNGDIKRDGVGIDDYTTTERKIGKWIDDSDLYQRTFEVTGLVNKQWNNSVLGTSGINIVESPSGTLHWLNSGEPGIVTSLNFFRNSSTYATTLINSSNDLDIFPNIADSVVAIDKAIITIKYTKPSVQANIVNANIQQTEEPTDEMR